MSTRTAATVGERLAAADWATITEEMNSSGCALTPQLLSPAECAGIAALYDEVQHFRSTIDMARYRFGSGQYRYFSRPYPRLVQRLREACYPRLLPIARDWAAKLGQPAPWPDGLDEWLERCHAASTRTVEGNGDDAATGSWADLHDPGPAGTVAAWLVGIAGTPRGQHHPVRTTAHVGHRPA